MSMSHTCILGPYSSYSMLHLMHCHGGLICFNKCTFAVARYAAMVVVFLALCQFPFPGVLEVIRVYKAPIGPRVIFPIGFRCFCALLQADVGIKTWGGAVGYSSETRSP